MVVFDTAILLLLFSPDTSAPIDPATKNPIEDAKERVDYLVEKLEKQKTKIIVPTPVLSELLVHSDKAGPGYLSKLNSSAAFRIIPFDIKAAIEVAAMTKAALNSGDKKDGGAGTWAKIKYDRQIVAIAKVEGATTIYSDDENIDKFAKKKGINVIGLSALPLRPEEAQTDLFKDAQSEESSEEDTEEEIDEEILEEIIESVVKDQPPTEENKLDKPT
ncbi:type II toxin-antitoxin system VapC family toxin [Candidatus Nitronereus thalassa]|uniref:PIN domain-containing protein n=1 Tax=Candidatus Nitronereus thalassa TaxID=3020898 RepID=A0ABU3K517_9BACT|nr:PIN domain-containing protein [Candidatus Nitronereus thalassa]MDT7041505.1 PIN domain-containing protein [Candidatus Nitronereus thalassa]